MKLKKRPAFRIGIAWAAIIATSSIANSATGNDAPEVGLTKEVPGKVSLSVLPAIQPAEALVSGGRDSDGLGFLEPSGAASRLLVPVR